MKSLGVMFSAVLAFGLCAGVCRAQDAADPWTAQFGVYSAEVDEQVIASLKTLGVHWLRSDIDWPAIEPVKGTYNWPPFDAKVRPPREQGIYLLPVFETTPAWAAADPTAAYKNFLELLINTYRPVLHYWEVRDTENLAFIYDQIERLDHMDEIVAGAPGAPGKLDIYAIQPAASAKNLEEELTRQLDTAAATAKELGDKPLWITAMSYPEGLAEEDRPSYLVRSAVIALSKGVQKFFWSAIPDTEQAFNAYAVASRTLSNAQAQETLAFDSTSAFGAVFTNAGKTVIVLWSTKKKEEVTIPVPAGTAAVTITGITGVTASKEANNGQLTLTLTPNPVYVLF